LILRGFVILRLFDALSLCYGYNFVYCMIPADVAFIVQVFPMKVNACTRPGKEDPQAISDFVSSGGQSAAQILIP
jgi:hypothetical protein